MTPDNEARARQLPDGPKIAFVGCGSHATNNLYPVLKYARCRLAAVCDLNKELAERNAALFGAARAHTDVDELIEAGDIDGVMVCGPPEMHRDVAAKALDRGLPVFVEKPPAPTLASARELVETAHANDTWMMVGFMKRHALTYGRIRQWIESGRFTPSCGFFRYTHWAGRDLQAMLLFMAIHPIDLALHLFGPAEGVHVDRCDDGTALSLGITLRFSAGRWAQLMLGAHGPRILERVELSGRHDGKDAHVIVDNIDELQLHTAGQNGIDLLAPTLWDIQPDFDLPDIQQWRPDFGIPNMGQNTSFLCGYAGEVRSFINAVTAGAYPGEMRRDVLGAMEVIDRILAGA